MGERCVGGKIFSHWVMSCLSESVLRANVFIRLSIRGQDSAISGFREATSLLTS
jgi:hypothetical protein